MVRKTLCILGLLMLALQALAQYLPSEANLKARAEFQDRKFGVFLHWGVYSMMGQGEWVMNNRNINYEEYAKMPGGFYPQYFNAEEWVQAFQEAGVKYITITSRHHDGFSMFHSKVSDGYNIVDATPFKRDVLKELAAACEKYGIKLKDPQKGKEVFQSVNVMADFITKNRTK